MKRSSLVLLLLPLVLSCATPPPVLCGPGPTFPLNVDRSQEVAVPLPAKQLAVKDAAMKVAPQAPAPARTASLPESTAPGAKRIKLYYAQPARRDPENCPSVTYVERDLVLGAAPAQTVMLELLKGPTQEEKAAGFMSAFDAETELKDVVVRGSLVEVRFMKLKAVAPDGCTAGSMRKQVISTMTALNIAGVTRVGITPMLKESK